MIVDNFDLLQRFLLFPTENSFYFAQVMKRRKDNNPDMSVGTKVLREKYIYSLEDFENLRKYAEPRVRLYLWLNMRDAKNIAFEYNKRVAEVLISQNYKSIPNLYASVVGGYHSDSDKKWIIDIDSLENDAVANTYYNEVKKYGIPLLLEVPTIRGVHLITSPFRLDVFRIRFPQIDVHKNSPTLLYYTDE